MYKANALVFSLFLLVAAAVSGWAVTYYIDYNAPGDSAAGTSPTAPWKHHPYMQGFTGAYAHAPGDVFVFKGGVTWPSSCFQMTIRAGGVANAPDTYTVDKTWYVGSRWTRPLFDGGYATLTGGQNIVSFSSLAWITFDNLEVTRHKSLQASGQGMFSLFGCNNIVWTNCYLHGWALDPGVLNDDAHGAIIHYVSGTPMTGMVVDNCTISNAEWTGIRQSGVAIRQVNTVRYSVLHDVSSLVLFCGAFYGNEVYSIGYPAGNFTFDPTYHTNVLYLEAWNGGVPPVTPGAVFNNVFRDLGAGTPAIYAASGYDVTVYIFNNLIYGANVLAMAVEIDPYPNTNTETVDVFNNTIVFPGGGLAVRAVSPVKAIQVVNNHVIGANVTLVGGTAAALQVDHNLVQTALVAAAQGYTIDNLYAPTSSTGGTVDRGVSESWLFSYDLLGATRPFGAAWDIGAYELTPASSPLAAPQGLRLKQ